MAFYTGKIWNAILNWHPFIVSVKQIGACLGGFAIRRRKGV